jgi:competence protein ComEA
MGPSQTTDTSADAIQQDVLTDGMLPDGMLPDGTMPDGTMRASEPSPRAVELNSPRDLGDVPPGEARKQQVLGMTHGDRRVVFAMACVLLLLMVVNWIKIVGWRPSPLIVERPQGDEYQFVVDVNTATWVEWMQLDGIGETMARRIVSHREEHGPFETIQEVDQISGIGPKTFSKIRDQLKCQLPPIER